MKLKLLSLVSWAFFALTPSLLFSQAGQPVKITSVEGITEYKLDNGLHVLLFSDQSKPTITVNITYTVGSRQEGYGETGMAHLLEHMMFKGSKNHPEVAKELSIHGANSNGSTWFDRTNYYEVVTANDDNLKWALDLESDRMVNSFIKQEDLSSEFSVVRNEFEMGENYPSHILHERVMSTAYLWHNYGKATIGSKEDIEKVPASRLQVFYKKYYQPDNAYLLVTGKFDEAKTLALINQYFSKIPKPTRQLEETYTVEPPQDGERICELRRSGDVQVVSCGYHICNGAHADYATIDILADVLTNNPSGRLYKALVESKKATELWGWAQALYDPGYIYFSADVLKDKPLDDAKKAMLDLMDNLKNNPITAEEVDRARNKRLKDFELEYNNSEHVGIALSEYIAQGDWRLWFLYRDRIEKVTPDDVNRVVKAYFMPSNRTVGLFIPEQNAERATMPEKPDLNVLLKDYKGKEKLDDAEKFDPTPENIDKRTKTGELPGGAKYAMLNKTTRGGAVNVNIMMKIGSAKTLSGKSKIEEFTGNMLMKGTATRSAQQINDELDKLKAQVNAYAYGQTVTVSIQTVHKNLDKVLKVVEDILRHPSFPQNEFDKIVQETLDQIDQQKSDPNSVADNRFNKLINPYPADDFRYYMTFDEQAAAAKKVTLNDVKKFYQDFFNGSKVYVGIVGEFDEPEVTKELTVMFENWKSAEKFEHAPDIIYDVAGQSEKINTPDKTNANLMAGYTFKMRDDNAEYPTLLLGNYMLGGGFLSARLAQRIRQKEGISYGVGSWVFADPVDASASFGSYAIYNPKNADKLMAAYKEELNKALQDGFTDKELKEAKDGLLQERKLSRTNDQGLAYRLTNNLYAGRNMEISRKIDDKINSATLSEVNSVFKKWIKPEKIVYVQAGDFAKQK